MFQACRDLGTPEKRPQVPEKGPTAVNTLNAALSAAAATLALGAEVFRFLRDRRARRRSGTSIDES